MRYLLIGNPNVGKSSVFNLVSESYAHVGNYGGITVEKKVGKYKYGQLIDLPGTYSVSPTSEDEGVVTYSLIHETYDGIVDVVDSTHLKRNLHLTIQLLELGCPVVIVNNMIDELRQTGKEIDFNKLGEKLKCQVMGISARTKEGIPELIDVLGQKNEKEPFQIYYGRIIEDAISQLIKQIKTPQKVSKRWLAIQLLEGNQGILDNIEVNDFDKIKNKINQCEEEVIKENIALSLKGAIFNYRRSFINNVMQECVKQVSDINRTKLINHKIDKWLTHPFFGLITFMLVMFGVYFFTFDFLGNIISNFIAYLMNHPITDGATYLLHLFGVKDDSIFTNLVNQGIIQGVGGVITFVPQIAILFFMLAIIEGTGYMSRVAIMLDTLLAKFGLNGKSIVPLVTGIGCNVPAIMATRTIASKRERLLTMAVIPFMSCSARIPIYALLATIFFNKYKAVVILSMYLIGTIVALVTAKVLSLSIFKNTDNHFILEIPPYRFPRAKNVYRHTKLMIMDFINKAGKFILIGTVVLWFLQYMGPQGANVAADKSFLAYLGNFLAPILKPLGFGSWQATSSLIVGFLAKELIYSSMLVIYGHQTGISFAFTGLSAFSFLVFSLLYMPCLATAATIYQESKSLRYTLFVLALTFSIAYVVSLLIYQIGSLIIAI